MANNALVSRAVPSTTDGQQLDPAAASSAEDEQRNRSRLLVQAALDQSGQTIDALAHIRDAAGQIHPDIRPRPDQACSTDRISVRSNAGSRSARSFRTRTPLQPISIRPGCSTALASSSPPPARSPHGASISFVSPR
jgi:hypothetical protein